jgi:hypothetical protein
MMFLGCQLKECVCVVVVTIEREEEREETIFYYGNDYSVTFIYLLELCAEKKSGSSSGGGIGIRNSIYIQAVNL